MHCGYFFPSFLLLLFLVAFVVSCIVPLPCSRALPFWLHCSVMFVPECCWLVALVALCVVAAIPECCCCRLRFSRRALWLLCSRALLFVVAFVAPCFVAALFLSVAILVALLRLALWLPCPRGCYLVVPVASYVVAALFPGAAFWLRLSRRALWLPCSRVLLLSIAFVASCLQLPYSRVLYFGCICYVLRCGCFVPECCRL